LLLCMIGIVAFRVEIGFPSRVNLLEYQRAVLYRRGLPIKDVGSGRHRVWIGSEKMIIVDIRPIQVSLENQQVSLEDASTAIFGISATAQVQDIRKAIYCARNYNQVPAFVFLSCSSLVLNKHTANQLRGSKDSVVEEITNLAKPRLAEAGFELTSFRLGQLSVASIPSRTDDSLS
jgi:hypothetical protein